MGIVLMLKWKMPLKYWCMLSSQRGRLGLQQAADIMVMGGQENGGNKNYR